MDDRNLKNLDELAGCVLAPLRLAWILCKAFFFFLVVCFVLSIVGSLLQFAVSLFGS